MSKEMNRRDFLKTVAVTGTIFLTTDMLKKAASAQGTIKIPEAENITITIITDNYYENDGPSYKIANRYSGSSFYAEHGIACHVETVVDGRSHALLFDFGPTFSGLSSNMDTLKIDVDRLEALALSHGHRDHCGGLVELLRPERKRYRKGFLCMWERRPSPRED